MDTNRGYSHGGLAPGPPLYFTPKVGEEVILRSGRIVRWSGTEWVHVGDLGPEWSAEAFVRWARDPRRSVAAHRPDDDNFCTACGQSFPCSVSTAEDTR